MVATDNFKGKEEKKKQGGKEREREGGIGRRTIGLLPHRPHLWKEELVILKMITRRKKVEKVKVLQEYANV